MKTTLLATATLAFLMVSLSAQAAPFSSFLALQTKKGIVDGTQRSHLPEKKTHSMDNMAMLKVFPMDRSWNEASLPSDKAALAPPAILFDNASLPKSKANYPNTTPKQLFAHNRRIITPSLDDDLPMIIPFDKPLAKLKKQKNGMLPNARRVTLRRNALAPMAFVEFCSRNGAHCTVSGEKEVKLTSASLATLKRVNRETNRAIRPRHDRRDVWSVNVQSGDCEDYALTKRAKLIKKGFPASALRMAVAKTPYGEGHAVLVVSTNRGDFVLDNRNNAIRPFNRVDLRWVKIQGTQNPLLWHEI